MKKLFLVIALGLLSTVTFSQFKLEKAKFPFTNFAEWPGRGTLFMADDPTGKTFEKNLSLYTAQGELAWRKSIYPKVKNSHLILSGNSNYIYFVDDLSLYNSREIRYNQVNVSGSIVHTSFRMLTIIKKYGYSMPDKLQLRDIIDSPKSLVFYFQLPVEDKGIIENIFVTITHHNNRIYSIKAPPSDLEASEEGQQDPFSFAGATAETICFSRYLSMNGKKSIEYTLFSPKAEAQVGHTYHLPDVLPIASSTLQASYTGAYYLKKETKTNFNLHGKGIYLEGHFFYAVNDAKERCLKIFGLNDNSSFTLHSKIGHQAEPQKKYKDATLTIFPLEKSVLIEGSIEGINSSYLITKENTKIIDNQMIDIEDLRKNPSIFKINKKTTKFVHFINQVPYFFDWTTNQRNKDIIFNQ